VQPFDQELDLAAAEIEKMGRKRRRQCSVFDPRQNLNPIEARARSSKQLLQPPSMTSLRAKECDISPLVTILRPIMGLMLSSGAS